MQFLPPSRAIAHFGSANCPAAYQGLKIITSLALRFPDFQRKQTDSRYSDAKSLFANTELTEYAQLDEQHPAFILYTSGTTGKPKGVTHSHQGAFHVIDIPRQALDFKHQDIILEGNPISHAGGLQTQLMPVLSVGAQVILSMRPSPAEATTLINQYKVSEYGLLARTCWILSNIWKTIQWLYRA